MMARIMLGVVAFFSLLTWTSPAPAADDLAYPPRYSRFGDDSRSTVGGVTILRGSPSRPPAEAPQTAAPPPQIVRAGVIGTGNNLWFVDSNQRIRACWLSGTGYVNSLRLTCTP
ncbi:MAG: hypothetical protein U1E42_05940 [Rhodospirillales bacterium]